MPNNSKILIWFWGRRGSGALHTLQLVEKFYEAGTLANVVIAISSDGDTLNLLKTLPFCENLTIELVETASALRSPFAFLTAIQRLRRTFKQLLSAYNFNQIIVPMSSAPCPVVIDIAKRMNVPVTYFMHDIAAHAGDPTAFIHALPQGWILRNVNQVICLSDYIHSKFKVKYPNIPSTCMPLITLYKNNTTQKNHAQPLKFLMLGRMLHYKNLNDILADAKILESNPNFTLTIAGDMDSSVLQPLHPNITFISKWLSDAEIEELYKTHHVLIANYLNASQSGPVAQAISYGMPCIVSDVGALPEQIVHGKAGWILAENTPECLVYTIAHVIENKGEFEEKSEMCGEMMNTLPSPLMPSFPRKRESR